MSPSVPRTLASASDDKTIRLWDLRTRRPLAKLSPGGRVFSVDFSRDGRTLASGGDDNTVGLWDVGTEKRLGTLTGHADWVYSVAVSPDVRTLASVSDDKTIRLWDVGTQQQVGKLTGTDSVLSVAFSRDGTLAYGDDTAIPLREDVLWDDTAALRDEVCTLVGTGLSKAEWDQYVDDISYRPGCS